MLQPCQDLALAQKPLVDFAAERTSPYQLECDLLLELAVGSIGQEDAAHAALTDLADQPVWSDAIARLFLIVGLRASGGRANDPSRVLHRRRFQEARGARVG